MRWQHPREGPPDDFIPLAENTDLIRPLTRFVLETALRQCAAWYRQGLVLSVAVNLSAQNLFDPQFPSEIGQMLAEWELDASWLELEITENSVLADPDRAGAVLEELAALGVGVSIDDFGTGYSSLAHLRQLPVREIKIDRSFVTSLRSDASDAVIVRSIIELARNLGLQVVAEGVETADTWQDLGGAGCHLAQGYYLCRPVSAPALTRWLGEGGHRTDADVQLRDEAPALAAGQRGGLTLVDGGRAS